MKRLEDLRELNVGDLVFHITEGHSYIVTANYGDRVTAVRTVDITNSREWEIDEKASR